MTRLFRTYLAFLLSVLLILTGQSLAASRGVSMAVGQMEICSGNGPVVVYMDAEGQPTGAPHYCPDCALMLLGAVAPGEAVLLAPDLSGDPLVARVAFGLVVTPVTGGVARAPPLSV